MTRALVIIMATAISLQARAQCLDTGMPDGPVQVGLGASDFMGGDFTVARSACPRTELNVREQGFFLSVLDELTNSATRDFQAVLGADTNVAGSYRLTSRLAAFASIDFVQWRQNTNAFITQTSTTFGPTSAGASYVVKTADTWLLVGSARLTFPTSTLYQGTWPFGLELGASGRMRVLDWLFVDGYLGLLGSLAFTPANAQPRGGIEALVGAQAAPWRHVSFVLDVDCLFAYDYPVDYCAAGPGVRAAIANFGLELGVLYPFAGGTRYNFSGGLRLSYRFDEPRRPGAH